MKIALLVATLLGVLVATAVVQVFRRLIVLAKASAFRLDLLAGDAAGEAGSSESLTLQDQRFLAAQYCFVAMNRRRLLRRYLQSLSRDFERAYAVAKLSLLHAGAGRRDLALVLLKQRLAFRFVMIGVRCWLVLQALGICSVDDTALAAVMRSMRDQLRDIAASLPRPSLAA